MISKLRGNIIHKDLNHIVLDVSGVGYKIFISPETLQKIIQIKNEEVSFWTHLAVRENALDLYGFAEKKELEFFEMLISISGIGPKSAMAILGIASVDVIRSAVSSGDTSYLTKVSGIGRKNAEKIVLELKDKLGKDEEFDALDLQEESDVVETLKALGYRPNEIREVLKKIPKEATGTSMRVKEALKLLGSK